MNINIAKNKIVDKLNTWKWSLPLILVGCVYLLLLSEFVSVAQNTVLSIFAFIFAGLCVFLSFDKTFYILTFLFCFRGIGGELAGLLFFNLLCCETIVVYGIKYLIEVIQKKAKIYWVPVILSAVLLGYTFINFNPERFTQIFDFVLLLFLGYLCFVYFKNFNLMQICKWFYFGIIFSGVIGLLLGLIEGLRIISFFSDNRFKGLTENPNHFELMNVIAIAMLVYLVIKEKMSLLKTIPLLMVFEVFGLLTQSKTFLICQLFIFIIFAYFIIKKYRKQGLFFLLILLGVGVLGCCVFYEKLSIVLERFTKYNYYDNWLDVISTGRFGIFKAYLTDLFQGGALVVLLGKGVTAPRTIAKEIHNLYLYIFYYLGVIGTCLIIMLLLSYFYVILDKKKRFKLINSVPMFMLCVLGMAEKLFCASTFIIFIPFMFLFDDNTQTEELNTQKNTSRFKFVRYQDLLATIPMAIAFIPAMITKMFIRDFWLICEDRNEARDNGYWFFKYVCEKHPDQKVAYAISKNSPDYHKVKDLGKIIEFGSLAHWFWYFVADKNISSQKGGKPNAALCYLMEVVLKLRKNNRVFLQHGVTKDDAKWLYFDQTNMRLFVTSTYQEQEFIEERFGYPKGNVQLLGMPRFDNLNNDSLKTDQILVMPTWRNWIAKEVECEKYEGTKEFTETGFYKAWSEFLNSNKLHKWLKKNNKTMVFYPHRNMQKYIDHFTTNCENITIARVGEYDVQALLKESSILITDYSSVYFDFAYLEKPIIFYQFDEAKFRQGQYQEGYFDYHNNDIGVWTDKLDDVIDNLTKIITGKGMKKLDAKKYFKYLDNKNCERNYLAIKAISKRKKDKNE